MTRAISQAITDPDELYDRTADHTVELANSLADHNPEGDPWDIADGLLAGAVHYWLFSRQPCGDPRCENCAPVSTPEARLAELQRVVEELARSSDHYHAPTDSQIGHA